MWKEKIYLTFPFLVISNIIHCDLIIEGDESLKTQELLLTKIEDGEEDLLTVINEKIAKNSLLSPLLFQMQPNLQLVQMHIPSTTLSPPSPHEVSNLMYSNPVYDVISLPTFQMNTMENNQVLVKLPVDIFSNIYKDPYENYNQILRDELLYNPLTKDFSNYNFVYPNQNQMIQLPYIPPRHFGGVGNLPTQVHSGPSIVTSNLQTNYDLYSGRFYPNLAIPGSIKRLNPLQIYSQPQEYLYHQQINRFNPASTAQHLYKGAASPPGIEIVKSKGYVFPTQVTTYQQEKFQPLMNTYKNPPAEQVMYYERTRNSNGNVSMQSQYATNKFNGEKSLEKNKTRHSSQYYHSNRKPITFDTYYADYSDNLSEVLQLKVNNTDAQNSTMLENSKTLNSSSLNLKKRPTKMAAIDDTNTDIKIKSLHEDKMIKV